MLTRFATPPCRWNQTIDRRLVHREAVSEVLLTEVRPMEDGQFAIGVQWPRGHRVYRQDVLGRADPMLLLETVRQAGLAVSHLGFDVPYGWRSLMLDVGFEFLGPEPIEATDLAGTLECRAVRRVGGRLSSMTVILTLSDGNGAFALGTGSIRWLTAASYSAFRLRTARPATAFRPDHAVPTRDRGPDDALLAAAAGDLLIRRLVVPVGHPVYFDHPLDHIPGMVLIDAAWQAARELLSDGSRLRRCRMSCPAFAELDRPTQIELDPAVNGEVRFQVEQGSTVVASGALGLRG